MLAIGFVRYIEAGRSWEGPLWEVLLYYIIIDNVYTLNEIVQGRLREGIMLFPRCP